MAFDQNATFHVGRLTRDPELSYTKSEVPVCKFSIANNSGKDDVNFFDCVAFKNTATSCAQYLRKGSQVVIEGRLKQSRWTDKNGQNRSKVEIVATSVQFIGAKAETGNAPEQSNESSAPREEDVYSLDQEEIGENPF